MPFANEQKKCGTLRPKCGSPCPGYGTSTVCPPLIVIAVLSTQQAMQDGGGSR